MHASSALWLPPQMPHKFVATGNVLLKTVLVSEAESETLGKVCFMTGISPLLRELLIAINQLPPSQSTTDKQQLRFSALETLILQEIKMGVKMSLELPWPNDERLQQLCENLLKVKSTPKMPQLVIELTSTVKLDIWYLSIYKTVHIRSFGGFEPDLSDVAAESTCDPHGPYMSARPHQPPLSFPLFSLSFTKRGNAKEGVGRAEAIHGRRRAACPRPPPRDDAAAVDLLTDRKSVV